MESFFSYWSMPLVSRLTLIEHLRLIVLVFLLVFVSVVVLHLFLPGTVGAALLHALQISLAYLIWFAALGGLLGWAMRLGWVAWLRVWHIWALSAVCYPLGYFAASFDDPLTLVLHRDIDEPSPLFHFVRLLPVWLLVTWVFVGTYVSRSRRSEIARLERLNQRLAGRRETSGSEPRAGEERVRIEAGRTRIDLPAGAVSHVSVEDHYCYLFHRSEGAAEKVAVGLPLTELMARLPDRFVQIHRSHAVNVDAVEAVERRGRNCWLRLAGSERWLPVSRQRTSDVLPRLESRSAP